MVEYNINELCSIDAIFDFFNKSNYKIEDDRSAFPISELIEKSVEGDAWLIVNHTNLMVIVIHAEKFNQKTYRTKVNNYLKELAGMKLIFYTDEFNYYHLTLIYDGIFSIKFKPSDPDMIIVRIFEALESGEDLFDFTKQDINFILLKRELTAKALKDSIKEGENSALKIIFQESGHKLIGKGSKKLIIAHKDAPIRDLAIDVDLINDNEDLNLDLLEAASELFETHTSRKLKLYCLITSSGIIYHWIPYSISSKIGFRNQMEEEVMDDVLESLIAQVSLRTAFNSETFHQQFGTYSPFYILGMKVYHQFFEKEIDIIRIMYEEWKRRFSKVYQAGDLDEELFIKHTYLALLIKTVLISKFVGTTEGDHMDDIQNIIGIFEERGVPIFLNDFFQWISDIKIVQEEVFSTLHNAKFIIDDLFRTIYQEMVSPATRHALGEFYTPPALAEKMIEESYKFGQYVLDPACGSGTFLVQILKFIDNSHNDDEEKIEAISKIYGFDINPIAVLVARSNLLLFIDKIFGSSKKIQINIFLADSLNPIDEFITDIDKTKLYQKIKKNERVKELKKVISLEKWGVSAYGESERFNMAAINDFLVINIKFFRYTELFGDLLKELDRYLSKEKQFREMLDLIYDSLDVRWLDEICEGNSDKTLKDNFEYMAKKFYDYVQKDKNHIWAYLLYNAIGVRKMKETMDGMDLIIGNPPWITINSILSQDYKKKIKEIGESFDIYIGGKHAPNAELSSIFFFKTCDLYLRKNGKIFFVLTAAIESGEQHSKFRMFNGFKDVFMWKFSNDVFRIHNICLGATYNDIPLIERIKVDCKIFNVIYRNKNWNFDLKKSTIYVPYNIDSINKELVAKRLIPYDSVKELLPFRESEYKKYFRRGADIFPRNFYFLKRIPNKIVPDKSLQQQKPWNFYPVEEYNIEVEYIFNVCKSTELVPFLILKKNQCFLPIEKADFKYHKDSIKPKSSRLISKFKKIYQKIQEKDERSITDLIERLDYQGGLSNSGQRSTIKVVYNSSGSILKSAIIDDGTIVDTTLYYASFDDLDEAYYICTILNAPCLTEQIKKTSTTGAHGSIRHIHHRALDFPIPQYDRKKRLHNEIVELGKQIEENIKNLVRDLENIEYKKIKTRIKCKNCGKDYSKKSFERYKEKHQNECERVEEHYSWTEDDWLDLGTININEVEMSRMTVQNNIYDDPNLKEEFKELDDLVINLLNSEAEDNKYGKRNS